MSSNNGGRLLELLSSVHKRVLSCLQVIREFKDKGGPRYQRTRKTSLLPVTSSSGVSIPRTDRRMIEYSRTSPFILFLTIYDVFRLSLRVTIVTDFISRQSDISRQPYVSLLTLGLDLFLSHFSIDDFRAVTIFPN